MDINFEGRPQIFCFFFQQNVSMLLLIHFRDKTAYQRSNQTNPAIIKVALMVSSASTMLGLPAFVVFLWPQLPEWHNISSVKQYIQRKKIKAHDSHFSSIRCY